MSQTNLSVVETLQSALGIVLTAYAQGAEARDKDGYPVNPTSEEACTFCSFGAIRKVNPNAFVIPLRFLRHAANDLIDKYTLIFDEWGTSNLESGAKLSDYYPEHIKEMFELAITKYRQFNKDNC